jgi:steroid 5-alpha reductase family enzyme
MRDHWGSSFWWVSLFTVFLLQGSLMWIISLPIQAVATEVGPEGWTLVDLLGIFLFIIGFLFEAVGDWQLRRFKANPATAGKVLDRGLWRYTRHPNYFEDALIWWGIFIVATLTPGGLLLVFSPVLMTFLLLKVSGVVLLESDIMERRPAYRHYVERTSAFPPWLPKTHATLPETESQP